MNDSKTVGIVFDLDGTLVDSHLDFELMRRQMRLPDDVTILEAIRTLPGPDAARCREILHRHERMGAERATPIEGVAEFLAAIASRGWRQGIVTRNSRSAAQAALSRLAWQFDPVLTRDDGPVKPDPWAIWEICRSWHVKPRQLVMIGDFHFDISAGRRAGVRTVFFTQGRDAAELAGADEAGFLLASFTDVDALLAWLDEPP